VRKNIAVYMDFNIHYLKYVSQCGKVKKNVDYSKVIRVVKYFNIFKIFFSIYNSDPHTLNFVCFWCDSPQWARAS